MLTTRKQICLIKITIWNWGFLGTWMWTAYAFKFFVTFSTIFYIVACLTSFLLKFNRHIIFLRNHNLLLNIHTIIILIIWNRLYSGILFFYSERIWLIIILILLLTICWSLNLTYLFWNHIYIQILIIYTLNLLLLLILLILLDL